MPTTRHALFAVALSPLLSLSGFPEDPKPAAKPAALVELFSSQG
jgi:hypothetical protein